MTKFHVNLKEGVIDIEGEKDFVEQVYKDFKPELLKFVGLPKTGAVTAPDGAKPEDKPSPKAKPSGSKKNGPSCASRILAIKTEKFFEAPRALKEISDKLEEKGTIYNSNQVSAALTNLIKRTELRRVKKDGSWVYQNP
jgi:hypothetical protein